MNRNLIIVFLLIVAPALADFAPVEWETLIDAEGRDIEARIVGVESGKVALVRKSDGRRFEVEIAKFSEDSRAPTEEWETGEKERAEMATEEGFSKDLYPRSRGEIKEALRAIEGRDKPGNIDATQHETMTELNIYRYLCGVPYDVEADPALVEHAMEAAEACEKKGTLSHDLGSYAEKLIAWGDEVPGRALEVPYVAVYQNAINFEPDSKPITGRGMYYVRIKGGSVREQYLVEIY